jgi:hypothetical protein
VVIFSLGLSLISLSADWCLEAFASCASCITKFYINIMIYVGCVNYQYELDLGINCRPAKGSRKLYLCAGIAHPVLHLQSDLKTL